jgi:hypothetical protein
VTKKKPKKKLKKSKTSPWGINIASKDEPKVAWGGGIPKQPKAPASRKRSFGEGLS